MKVRIDLEVCVRSGECYYNHPELVRMGDAGDPTLIATDIDSEALQQHAREAAEVCPAGAYIIEE